MWAGIMIEVKSEKVSFFSHLLLYKIHFGIIQKLQFACFRCCLIQSVGTERASRFTRQTLNSGTKTDPSCHVQDGTLAAVCMFWKCVNTYSLLFYNIWIVLRMIETKKLLLKLLCKFSIFALKLATQWSCVCVCFLHSYIIII